MALSLYTDGAGASSGDRLVTTSPLYCPALFYLDSVTGSDSYAGVQRSKPFATLGAAVTAASAAGAVIVVLSTHAETLAAKVTVAQAITIVGEGSSSGYPTATFTPSVDDVAITCSTAGFQLRNLKFAARSVDSSNAKVFVNAANFTCIGCRFESSVHDISSGGYGLELGTSATATVRDCSFASTSTTIGTLPVIGLYNNGTLNMYDTEFSDGSYGYSSYAYSQGSSAKLRAEGIALLLGAEMYIGAGATYHVNVSSSSGGGRIVQ